MRGLGGGGGGFGMWEGRVCAEGGEEVGEEGAVCWHFCLVCVCLFSGFQRFRGMCCSVECALNV